MTIVDTITNYIVQQGYKEENLERGRMRDDEDKNLTKIAEREPMRYSSTTTKQSP